MNRGNVLLIDDEEKLRHLLKRIIGLEGFLVFEADSLKAGLRCSGKGIHPGYFVRC